MTRFLGSTTLVRQIVRSARTALVLSPFAFVAATAAQAQTPIFTPGNLVVVVSGCGLQGGTCTAVPNGSGDGTNGTSASPGNSTVGGYGDNQASPLTLFQFAPTATTSLTYVNSLVLPQTASGANLPVAAEYGSSSEGGLTLSGQGQYLTVGSYGINPATFNANFASYSSDGNKALAQTGSLTGQSYTPVPRVVTLVDAFGNTNSSSAIFNVFNTNNIRSAWTADGTSAYISGQGNSPDPTGGVFYTALGAVNNAPTAITGLDTSANTSAQDTRFVTGYNGTLYVSMDSKEGSNNARSFIGTLGNPPTTSLFQSGAGPLQLTMTNNLANSVSSAGKITITAAEANTINAPIIADSHAKTDYPGCSSNTASFNISPSGFFFANAYTLYVADTGNGKQTSGNCLYGDGGLQKWVNSKSDGTGTWVLEYTLSQGLNLVANPSAVPTNTTGTTGLYALTGVVNGANVYLYATNATIGDLDQTYIYGITDPLTATSNSNTFTLLATAPPDSNFKGISFAPTVPAGSATITTVPAGLQVTTAGTGCAPGTYTTPATLVWTPGSACTLSTTTPQTVTNTPYFFTHWQDNTTNTTDSVVAPATAATYTATFSTTFQPVVTVTPVSIPVGTASATLTASIAYAGTVAPTGPVIFTVNGSSTGVGSTTCTGSTSPLTCTAPYSPLSLVAGSYAITVNVPASGALLASSGNALLTVTAAPDFTFTPTAASQSVTVTAGSPATYVFNLAPGGSYPGPVTFKVSGLPTGATATFTPNPVLTGAQTVTMTVATAATSAANARPASPWNTTRTSLVLAGICLLPLGLRRRVRKGILQNVALALCLGCTLVGLAGLTGCSSTPLPKANSVFTLTVTATSGSVSHATTVTLNVQ